MEPIVTTTWLRQHLQQPDLIILDASLASTAEGKTATSSDETIPGARFFDLKNKFSDQDATFPNTLPSPQQFEKECRALGINDQSKLIVFDNLGVYSSPRVWWMFKAMGHQEVYVLDGGLPAWIEEGHPTALSQEMHYDIGNFGAIFQPDMVKTYEEMVTNVELMQFTVVDARSTGRFQGTAPEPRKSLRSGHIPGSVNIPYQNVLHEGRFKSVEALKALFESTVSQESAMTFSCGSGLTACIVLLAGHLAGNESAMVYDGSWTEWATLQGLRTQTSDK